MLPNLSFTIDKNPSNPLEILFRGVYGGSGTIDSWLWDFGDGETSTEPSPRHTFSGPGIYFVSLSAINSSGIQIYQSWVSFQTTQAPGQPIMTLLRAKLGEYMYTLFQPQLVSSVEKWQMYLQPQVEPELDESQTFVETAWPALWNYLIVDLVRLDLLQDEAVLIVLNQATQSASSTQTSATSQTETGSIKRVETGPSVVEFHPDGSKEPDKMGQFLRYVFETQRGMIETYKQHCCTLALRLKATLPFCPQPKVNFLFKKAKPC